jgi:hypothetical protein
MQQVARETWVAFEQRLERAQVPAPQRPDYHKWTRFYLDFCHKYGHPPRSPTSLGPFLRSDLEGAIMLRNYSRKTLAAYRLWVGKFQAFVHSRPTDQLGGDEVRGFLTELAVRYGVAAATQNQAFNALLFSMIYLQTVPSVTLKEAKSPLDCL